KDARLGYDVINLSNPMRHVGDMLVESTGPLMVPAASDGDTVKTYPTTWYPDGPTLRQASVVKVDAGETKAGIDIHLVLQSALRISGTVAGPADEVGHLGLRLMPAGLDDVAASYGLSSELTATDASGAFTFLSARPGSYVIRAETIPTRTF